MSDGSKLASRKVFCKKAEDTTRICKSAVPVCKKSEDMTRKNREQLCELGFSRLCVISNNKNESYLRLF